MVALLHGLEDDKIETQLYSSALLAPVCLLLGLQPGTDNQKFCTEHSTEQKITFTSKDKKDLIQTVEHWARQEAKSDSGVDDFKDVYDDLRGFLQSNPELFRGMFAQIPTLICRLFRKPWDDELKVCGERVAAHDHASPFSNSAFFHSLREALKNTEYQLYARPDNTYISMNVPEINARKASITFVRDQNRGIYSRIGVMPPNLLTAELNGA